MSRPIGLLGLLMLLAGCASSDPHLYTLETRAGPSRSGAPHTVTVRGAGVPRYLDRLEIVQGAGAARLAASDNDWWAEPLRVMVARVTVDDLTQRLPGADVLADGTIAAHPDAEVLIELTRFESDGAGAVRLVGTAAVETFGRGRATRRLDIRVPVAGARTSDQVDAMSAALGQAADQIAGLLAP